MLLSEIKLAEATTKDFARALNYSMKKSKKTANVLTGQLNLTGPMKPNHVLKMYPADTFTKEGKLHPIQRLNFMFEMQKMFPDKKLDQLNMLDYANAVIKSIIKR